MIQLNKNSMKPQKPTGQRKDPWPQGHATAQLPKYMGRTEDTIQKEMQKSQTWEKLKEISYCYSTDKMISCHIPVQTLRADVKIFKGGNIANFFVLIITQNQFSLNIVKFPLTMEFAKVAMCQFVPLLNFCFVEIEIIDAEISKLLSKGAIVNTIREPSHYVSWVFTRTKIDGNYRMILNQKTFSEFLKFKHCK